MIRGSIEYLSFRLLPLLVEQEDAHFKEEHGLSSVADDGMSLWAVSSGESNCDHLPEDVEYIGDDGVNLHFECRHCGAALIASDAIHLLT